MFGRYKLTVAHPRGDRLQRELVGQFSLTSAAKILDESLLTLLLSGGGKSGAGDFGTRFVKGRQPTILQDSSCLFRGGYWDKKY